MNSSPISSLAIRRVSWRPITPVRCGAAATRASARAPMLHAGQELALRRGSRPRAPCVLRRRHHRGEVGVDGQVCAAGVVEGIDLLVAVEGLEGVAEPGLGAAVVDQQGRAAISGDPAAEFGAQGGLGRRLLEDLAGGGVGQEAGGGRIGEAEGEMSLGVEAHHLLGPAHGGAHELAGGQGSRAARWRSRAWARRPAPRPGSAPSSPAHPGARPEGCEAAPRSPPARRRRRSRSPRRDARSSGHRPSACRRPGPISISRSSSWPAHQLPGGRRPATPISSSPNIWLTMGAVMKSPASPRAGRVA